MMTLCLNFLIDIVLLINFIPPPPVVNEMMIDDMGVCVLYIYFIYLVSIIKKYSRKKKSFRCCPLVPH